MKSQRLTIPPRYAIMPAEHLFDQDLPDPLFRSLGQICALAWQTKGERTPPATVIELAAVRGLQERRMYDHLRELKERGYIRVENLGDGRIVIFPLRWVSDTGASFPDGSTLTQADLDALTGGDDKPSTAKDCSSTAKLRNNNINTVVVDSEQQQQQQDININTPPSTAKFCSNADYPTAKDCSNTGLPTAKNCSNDGIVERLTAFGVQEDTAIALAQTCTLDQVNAWITYADNRPNLRDAAAFVVSMLQKGQHPPQRRDDRRRYITGKYADLIKH